MTNELSVESVGCQTVACQSGQVVGYQACVALESYIIASIILKLFIKKSFSFKYHFSLIFFLFIFYTLLAFLFSGWRPKPVNLMSIIFALSLAFYAYKTMFPQKLYAYLKKL